MRYPPCLSQCWCWQYGLAICTLLQDISLWFCIIVLVFFVHDMMCSFGIVKDLKVRRHIISLMRSATWIVHRGSVSTQGVLKANFWAISNPYPYGTPKKARVM